MTGQSHMAAEVRAWLNDLRPGDPAEGKVRATALLDEGPGLGPPLLVTAGEAITESDPAAGLDYAYQRQFELLSQVRRGVADTATSRKRLELQIRQLEQQAAKLAEQRAVAAQGGREDLAQEAATRYSAMQAQLGEIRSRAAEVAAEIEESGPGATGGRHARRLRRGTRRAAAYRC